MSTNCAVIRTQFLAQPDRSEARSAAADFNKPPLHNERAPLQPRFSSEHGRTVECHGLKGFGGTEVVCGRAVATDCLLAAQLQASVDHVA